MNIVYKDKNNNIWTKGTLAEAKRKSRSLTRCRDCIDCEWCYNCRNCEDCKNCEWCVTCKECQSQTNKENRWR